MWGGFKGRKNYTDVFKRWSATKGLEELREALFQEPRPWFLGFSLHQQNHLLQDHHIARLTSWCTTLVQLQPTKETKTEAYRYSQEMFNLLVGAHKPGKQSLFEYFRLCAIGKDLTSAYNWQKYWIEAHLDGSQALVSYTWLIRIALLHPSDEAAEDMVAAVRDSYLDVFCQIEKVDASDRNQIKVLAFKHFQPTNDEQADELRDLFSALKAIRPRVRDRELAEFIEALPLEETTLSSSWPGSDYCHTFPQLEGNETPLRPFSVLHPRLVDSILHPELIHSLEKASFEEHNVAKVIEILKHYQSTVQEEKEKPKSFHLKGANIWRQFSDPTAVYFRRSVVTAGGLTPELYHYVITALCLSSQPTAALRTLSRMEESNMRILDATRFVCMVAAKESKQECGRLFRAQLDEIRLRRQIDEDHDTCKEIEHYWKFQYTDFLHYRNRLDETTFYLHSLRCFGVARVQQLLEECGVQGESVPQEELVVFNPSLREAAVTYFKGNQHNEEEIQSSLDAIAQHMPLLDVSLIGEDIPSFKDYCLPEEDQIHTEILTLRDFLKEFRQIFVVDTSFVETSENFMQLGRQAAADSKCLVLFPFTVLKELATSAKQTSESVLSFDVDLQESFKKEEQLAGTRLRSLCTLLSSEGPHCRRRVLHFTECLLAGFFVCGDTSGKLSSLHTSENSNDELLAILVMLRSLAAPETEVHLCCDDPELLQMVVDSGEAFRGGSVVLLSSSSPEEMQDFSTGLINDNPVLDLGLDFEPKLAVTADLKATSEEGEKLEEISTGNSPAAKQDTTSPWLEMLNEADDGESTAAPTATMVSAPETQMTTTPHEEDHHPLEVDLMNVYQSPHDVIPVGQKIKEAAEMGTVFDEFDVLNPEDLELLEANEAARRSPLSLEGNTGKKRRRSLLEKEYLQNRGLSNKERYQTARTLSNMSGARVPFNLRYNVVEANVNHPKNRELKKSYEAGLQKKRGIYKKKNTS